MPPKRSSVYEAAEQRAVLEKLIALFVARGVPPFVPQLAGNGRTQQHAIFAAAGSDGNTPWGEELMCGLMAV